MRRRMRLLALALLAVVVAAVLIVLLRPLPPSRITRENCLRVEAGMTSAEVVVILGPPGDYKTAPTSQDLISFTLPGKTLPGNMSVEDENSFHKGGFGLRDPGEYRIDRWYSDTGAVVVVFDRRGRVASNHFFQLEPRHLGLVERLCWRLERLWHRGFR